MTNDQKLLLLEFNQRILDIHRDLLKLAPECSEEELIPLMKVSDCLVIAATQINNTIRK